MAGMIEWTIRHRVFSVFVVDGLTLPGTFYRDFFFLYATHAAS